MRNALLILVAAALTGTSARAAEHRVPIVYSTDLFHPHADPDDHYDLACLFALPEFDVRGIILDLGGQQAKGSGRPAVEQMQKISARRVPCEFGLSRRLRSRDDQALDEPPEFQGGVRLLLAALAASPEKVVLFTTGSCRDVAAAFNRQPDLLRQKAAAVYFNIGRGPNEPQEECNVGYDPEAYLRMFESGLPLYWCPCFGKDGYETLYQADQNAVVGACARPVQNYFVYCLTKSQADPLAFLQTGPHPLPTGPRAMWCTAPMFHAAGRRVYERAGGQFVALPPAVADRQGLTGKEVNAYRFVPVRASIDEPRDRTESAPAPAGRPTATYLDRKLDRVGTGAPEPDGRADCRVRVVGVEAGKPIQNIVLTGPREGRWEYVATERWWRVAYERSGGQLDVYFQFYAPGEHRIEIVFQDRSTQSATFQVPDATTGLLRVELNPVQANGWVFQSVDPRYKPIMASCLKNLLAELGSARK
jgi:hypothetical protein